MERALPALKIWPEATLSNGEALVLHFENADETPIQSARFLLDRLKPAAGGGLTRTGPVAIPGYPIALAQDGSLVSIEPAPGQTGAGLLHRVQLAATDATVLATQPVDAHFGTAAVVGDRIITLREPGDVCELELTLESRPLALDGSPPQTLRFPRFDYEPIVMAGIGYGIVAVAPDGIVLGNSESRTFLRVSVDAGGALSLSGFASAPCYIGHLQWQGDVIFGSCQGRDVTLAL